MRQRRKSKGPKAVWLEVLPEGANALRALRDAPGLGKFSTQALNAAWQRWCKSLRAKAKEDNTPTELRIEDHITPYQFRHTLITLYALASRDERVVQECAQHTSIKTTRRYTERSVSPRAPQGVTQLRELLAA